MCGMDTSMEHHPLSADFLEPRELRTIYKISRVILQAVDTSAALKQIVYLARPIFIFDNVVLFQQENNRTLSPTYARALGRGRSTEADMAWGEAVAGEVFQSGDVVLKEEKRAEETDDRHKARLNTRFFLGLPLWVGGQIEGVLVFIRFGGPAYLPEQVKLARLIAEHIERLLERQILVERVANLEAERRLDRLQQEFVATITHDLKSPLGFIKGYATTLLRDDAQWDAQTRKEFLTIIEEEADRLAQLIDNLLDSSRLQTGTLRMDFQPVNPVDIMRDFQQRVQLGNDNLDVKFDIETCEEVIWVDPYRIMQVLDNLLSNALKYAPDSPVRVSLSWEPQRVHICFQDFGPGIPEDQLDKIFKRFYRVPAYANRATGSGLGLFICQKIIRGHHGEIFAESTLGEGAAFHVFLPRKWRPAESAGLESEESV